MVIRGYDYEVDFRDDMFELSEQCKSYFVDELLESCDRDYLQYEGMLGSRVFLGIPQSVFGNTTALMSIVNTVGKFISDKYGVSYGIELIPKEYSEYLMHIIRKLHDIEHTIIVEKKNGDQYERCSCQGL